MDLHADIYNMTLSPQNKTVQEDEISNPPKMVALVIVTWTLFANGAIVVCFIRNRHTIWTTYSRPVLSLAINDICLGVSSFFMIIVAFMTKVDKVPCSIGFYFFFSAQCAILYNILVICIHRTLSIRKTAYTTIKPFYSGLMIFLAWFVSFVVCALPFLLWRSTTSRQEACLAMTIINQQKRVAKLLVLAYLAPLILTNILYVSVIFKLHISLRKVAPIETVDSFTPPSATTTNGRQRTLLKLHLRVVGTIGIILLITDACTVPLLSMYTTWWMSGSLPQSRDVRYFGSCVFLMNSALNPFVYAGRTKPLREALKRMTSCTP